MKDRDTALAALATAAGIATAWEDAAGQPHEVSPDTLRALLAVLDLPAGSVAQIRESHDRLAREPVAPSQVPPLAAPVPDRCFSLADATGAGDPRHGDPRLWGIAAQLYGLRRHDGAGYAAGRHGAGHGDLGCGDTTALASLARAAAAQGAACIGVSPVHALFDADPLSYSPYSPSSRLFLNTMIIDADAIAGADETARSLDRLGLGAEARRVAAEPLIDWPAVARVKQAVMHDLLARHGARIEADPDYRGVIAAGGDALADHARFEAIDAHMRATHGADGHTPHGWRGWPEAFRDPRSPAVAAFARDHQGAVARAQMLQWQASRGLGAAHQAARDAGMAVGLIADLAIGVDGSGAQAWSHQDQMLIGATIGAPPDLFNPLGQNWGLAAFSPRALAASGHAAYIQMLRAALRHAGGIRIDHILGLMRLWLIPEGAAPAEGAYLRYPLQDLLHATVLESRRHNAVVIGEDLGTVPAGFRDMLGAHGILGTRVLWFERDAGGDFLPPDRWERPVVATATTHDLPTTAGWWAGADIDWRERLGLFGPGETAESLRELRALDRSRLWSALGAAGSVDGIAPAPHASADPVIDGTLNFLGQTPTPLVLAPLEDLAGLGDQPNLPGTIAEHPNWRRRMPAPVPDLLETPAARRRLSMLRAGRRPEGDPS